MLVFFEHLAVLDNSLTVLVQLHPMLLLCLLVAALQGRKLFLPLRDSVGNLVVHPLAICFELLVDLIKFNGCVVHLLPSLLV